MISGRFDLLVEVLVHSNRGLVSFLTGDLAEIEGITRTKSFVLLKSFYKLV
jgi:DNA-binding Lrp family transcriptional regulator